MKLLLLLLHKNSISVSGKLSDKDEILQSLTLLMNDSERVWHSERERRISIFNLFC